MCHVTLTSPFSRSWARSFHTQTGICCVQLMYKIWSLHSFSWSRNISEVYNSKTQHVTLTTPHSRTVCRAQTKTWYVRDLKSRCRSIRSTCWWASTGHWVRCSAISGCRSTTPSVYVPSTQSSASRSTASAPSKYRPSTATGAPNAG